MMENEGLAVPTAKFQRIAVKGTPDIRIDQAMRWTVNSLPVAAQNSQVELYNNAPQGQYIVLRAFAFGPTAALPAQTGYKAGRTPGGPSGAGAAMMPDRGMVAGIVTAFTSTSFASPDFFFYNDPLQAGFIAAFPFAVLPPNWSIQFATNTVNQLFTVNLIWEVLSPEQLAETYGLYS